MTNVDTYTFPITEKNKFAHALLVISVAELVCTSITYRWMNNQNQIVNQEFIYDSRHSAHINLLNFTSFDVERLECIENGIKSALLLCLDRIAWRSMNLTNSRIGIKQISSLTEIILGNDTLLMRPHDFSIDFLNGKSLSCGEKHVSSISDLAAKLESMNPEISIN